LEVGFVILKSRRGTMRRSPRRLASVLFILIGAVAVAEGSAETGAAGSSEGRKPLLEIGPFAGGAGVGPNEVEALRNLVTSYIVEFNTFRVIDSKDVSAGRASGTVASKALSPADFSVTGSILETGSLYVATLVSTNLATGEKRSVSDAFSSINELILSSRRLALALFERNEAAAQEGSFPDATPGGFSTEGPPNPDAGSAAPAAEEESPSLAQLAGSWSGDKGVERVNLFADGRGVALLDSGAVMRLKVTISGSIVTIVQDQTNLPTFYRGAGIDNAMARSIAAKARPWVWSFRLSADGKRLFGSKESVYVRVSSRGEVSVDNGYVRKALWTRR
jgi:hypothetical protein